MKKSEIQVGGVYSAKVSGNIVSVRVDKIRKRGTVVDSPGPYGGIVNSLRTVYDVTNLNTKRKTTFRSAAKFRGIACITTYKG